MAVYYRTQGFILSKDDLREADQLFNIYTKDFGKLQILARAVRKIKSKLRSGIELFYLSEIEFIQGRNYKTLTDAVLIDKFKNIRKDLLKLEIAYKIVELTDNLIKGQESDQKLFNLLNETFNKLNNYQLPAVNCQLIYPFFLWNFLYFLGFQMDFYNCAVCQKKLVPQNLSFSPRDGGIVCAKCRKETEEIENITPETVKILRLFLKRDWTVIFRLKFTQSHREELESVSEKYLLHVKQSQNIL